MDMASTGTLPRTDLSRPAGLVSVDGRTYPLKSARLEARAEGGVAATTFTQTYGNPYQEPLEVLYTLPLPADGAVTGYTIRLGNRVIRGEVRKRDEAKEQYRKALLEGRTAALLEQERADTFTQKLGCLPPGETAEVEIRVVQLLAYLPSEGSERPCWEYRFPTVAGVRYEGAEGRVPDAERLDVDRAGGLGTPARLEASLLVMDGPAQAVLPQAPGRELDLQDRDGGVCVSLRDSMRLDRDLVIRWAAAQQEVGVRLVEGRGLPGDDGRYLLITLTPPAAVREGMARDLTILIDASGSMSGIPISRAKIVAEELLHSLDPEDRFEILAFSNDVKRLVGGLREASPGSVRKALAALHRLEAGGATEMTRAMVEALKPLRPDSQRQVILITDGYIGFEAEVIGEVLRRLVPGARLHAVGIGSAPNRTLIRGAARAGRGVEILVGDDDDARAASRQLLRATVRPVLTDLEVSGPALTSLAPGRPQDVLEGQPLILLAEISASGGELEIRGKQASTPASWQRRIKIPPSGEKTGTSMQGSITTRLTTLPLGALFGREAIEDVELQLAADRYGRGHQVLEGQIEKLGLRHQIASRKTSLIAISEDPTVDPKDPRRRERLPVEIPAEVSAEGAGLAQPVMLHALAGAPVLESLMCFEEEELRSALLHSRSRWALGVPAQRVGVFRRKIAGTRPRRLLIRGARVLYIEGPFLVFEFEVPETGFLLPLKGEKLNVRFEDGSVCGAEVLGEQSSPQGPHLEGLSIRLALKLEGRSAWAGKRVLIRWIGRIELTEDEVVEKEIEVHIMLGGHP
jgi:Ca-activated chloride channel family protein